MDIVGLFPTGGNPLAPDVVAGIIAEHEACNRAVGDALGHATECGRLLSLAKSRCQHGEWEPWVAANCPFSLRTAQAYMRIQKNRPALDAKAQHVALLGVRGALEALAEPKVQPKTEPLICDDPRIYIDPDLIPPEACCIVLKAEGVQVWIVPYKEEPGFYYHAIIIDDPRGGAEVAGGKKPCRPELLPYCLQEFWDNVAFGAKVERIVGPMEPWSYNEILYDSHEDYVNTAILGRPRGWKAVEE